MCNKMLGAPLHRSLDEFKQHLENRQKLLIQEVQQYPAGLTCDSGLGLEKRPGSIMHAFVNVTKESYICIYLGTIYDEIYTCGNLNYRALHKGMTLIPHVMNLGKARSIYLRPATNDERNLLIGVLGKNGISYEPATNTLNTSHKNK